MVSVAKVMPPPMTSLELAVDAATLLRFCFSDNI